MLPLKNWIAFFLKHPVGETGEKWDNKFNSWQICSISEFRNVIDIVWLLLIKANICTLHRIYWRLGTFISSELWVILKSHLMGEMWDRVGEKWDTYFFFTKYSVVETFGVRKTGTSTNAYPICHHS